LFVEALTPEKEHVFDVIIVGGGMVGLSAALGFAKLGLSVAVLEAHKLSLSGVPETPSFDSRSTALSYGSRKILEDLGVWSAMADLVSPISSVHVSQKGMMGVSRMTAAEMSCPELGYVAPNQVIGASLLQALSNYPVALLSECQLESFESGEAQSFVGVKQANKASLQLLTTLLVIADGSMSTTAGLVGIDYSIQPYQQHAVIANVTFQQPHSGVAYERFTQRGPLALLPLKDRNMSLVWTIPDDDIAWYESASDAAFIARLQKVFGDRLGEIERVGLRVSYPLKLVQAKELYRRGLLVLGNAAHSLHPVAGQGFNLALRGVARAIESIAIGVESGVPISSPNLLGEAIEAHQQDQKITVGLSDQLVKKFSQSSPLLGLIRDAGIVGLNNSPLPKKMFTQQTMGQATRQVPLSRYFSERSV
jgi:2-octaprenyl-6-methoxyphenol hydroxylase